MANMAERVWQVAGPIVKELMKENEGYDLVLTGHSLGAGVACLLNILLHENDSDRPGLLHVDGRRVKVQCFAYASPPVFAPKVRRDSHDSRRGLTAKSPAGTLIERPTAALLCTNYIHEMDVVPFLSVDSIRHFFKCIAVLEEHHHHHPTHSKKWWWSSLLSSSSRLIGDFYRDPAVLDAVQRARTERLRTKPGAPLLAIPAANNVWIMQQHRSQQQQQQQHDVDGTSSGSRNQRMSGDDASVYYDQKLCDPIRLATLGIHLDLRMLQDHFPSRYEHALHHLLDISNNE
jgi:Lipase (class 3)